eukprot:SAG31_NODE_790_length_12082_cov_8.754319_2_plen_37_part_00
MLLLGSLTSRSLARDLDLNLNIDSFRVSLLKIYNLK